MYKKNLLFIIFVFAYFYPIASAFAAYDYSCLNCHKRKIHADIQCVTCHNQEKKISHPNHVKKVDRFEIPSICTVCHKNPEYDESTHGKALKEKGLVVTAVCIDCHNPHQNVSLPRADVPKKCSICHPGIYNTYIKSIHGKKFIEGDKDVPVCTDCHGEHSIKSGRETSSNTYSKNVPDTCSKCHASDKLIKKYDIAQKVSTYKKSFHGIALKSGRVEAAQCASCHGSHNVLPPSDPDSTINPKNIPNTCGKCHKGATANFAKGKIHIDPFTEKSGIIYLINIAYRIIIVGMILGFLTLIFLDLYGKFIRIKK